MSALNPPTVVKASQFELLGSIQTDLFIPTDDDFITNLGYKLQQSTPFFPMHHQENAALIMDSLI